MEKPMTSRDRLEAALRGKLADRIGWAPEINDLVTERNIRAVEAGKLEILGDVPRDELNEIPYARSNQIIGGDTLLRVKPYRTEYDGVRFGRIDEGDEVVETVETPKGRLTSRIRKTPESATNFRYEFFIKGPDDYPVWRDVVERTRHIPDYDEVARIDRKLGAAGMISLETPCTPYMDFVMWTAGVEPLMYQIFDHENELRDLFERMHQKNLEACRIAAECPIVPAVRPIEDTSQHLSSPELFKKFIRRHMHEMGEAVHWGGKLYIPHMCGHLADMLPILKHLAIDGIEAITPPPTGNCPVSLARKVLGSQRILIGGIDPTRYALSEPGEFERTVQGVLDEMKDDPRFILGHEEIQVSARWENIRTVSRFVREAPRS